MEVVIIMGLFDKFKKKEDVQQIKTDEQRELENIVQQNHAIFDNAFLGKRATDKEILQAEQKLGVKIPAPFVWFLKEFGSGGYWFDFIGYTKNGKAQFVEETFNQRENGLPENFLVIEDCDEFYHCLDTSNGKIASWSQYDNDGVIYRFDNFYDFFRDNLENAIENF